MTQTSHERIDRYGLLPTPEIPSGLSEMHLTDNARQVLIRRYVRRDREGKPAESVDGMFWRVAYHVAKVENTLEWCWDETGTAILYTCSPVSNSFPTHPPLLVRGLLWVSWQPVLSYRSRMIWVGMKLVFSKPCVMPL